MRLVLTVRGATLEFTPATDDGPYPWLNSVGTLRMAAQAGDDSGFGVAQSPSLRVDLDNSARQLVRLIGRPLRERAEIFADDGASFFAGLVSNITYGQTVTLEIGT